MKNPVQSRLLLGSTLHELGHHSNDFAFVPGVYLEPIVLVYTQQRLECPADLVDDRERAGVES